MHPSPVHSNTSNRGHIAGLTPEGEVAQEKPKWGTL